jgi:hypothetical protein
VIECRDLSRIPRVQRPLQALKRLLGSFQLFSKALLGGPKKRTDPIVHVWDADTILSEERLPNSNLFTT